MTLKMYHFVNGLIRIRSDNEDQDK